MCCQHVLQPTGQENAPAIILGIVFSALVYVLCLIALLEPLINNGSYVANEKAAAAILGLGISGCFVLVTPGWSDWEAPLLLLPSPYLGVLFEAKTSALGGHCPLETSNLNRSPQDTKFYALISVPSAMERQMMRAVKKPELLGREAGMV
ncbi:hypothetical protein CKAH01_11824 [Colletotrichum kahawae]|uniref:Uncharacterized protein n=1 Tax=Colletotrichum kahawae TaxID=34407 RepID=A0AAD9YT01_COLKA|nr:hypothetical protein CKAH01_11824 [Colletotrichum kahawae]